MYVCVCVVVVLAVVVADTYKAKSGETLVEASRDTNAQIVRFAWREGRKTNRTVQLLIPSAVSLRRAGVEQLYQVKRMFRGSGHVLFSTFSQTLNVSDPKVSCGEPLKHVIPLCASFGEQN